MQHGVVVDRIGHGKVICIHGLIIILNFFVRLIEQTNGTDVLAASRIGTTLSVYFADCFSHTPHNEQDTSDGFRTAKISLHTNKKCSP